MSEPAITLPLEQIEGLCREYRVRELSLFGSALRDDFDPAKSDIDFLVEFLDEDLGPWAAKLTDFQEALATVLGRPADVVLKESVERSENYIRRRHILKSAEVLYVA